MWYLNQTVKLSLRNYKCILRFRPPSPFLFYLGRLLGYLIYGRISSDSSFFLLTQKTEQHSDVL